jgi:hypothetical protein
MKISHWLYTLAICALLALEVGAAELHARNQGARSDMEQTAESASPEAVGSRALAGSAPNYAASGKGIGANRQSIGPLATPGRGPISAQHGTAKLDRSNTDRVRSLLRQQSARTAARPAGAPVASQRAAPMVAPAAVRGPREASAVAPSRLSPSKGTSHTLQSVKAPIRGSSIGGPKIAGAAQLGGPARGLIVNQIDGTQVHRRF